MLGNIFALFILFYVSINIESFKYQRVLQTSSSRLNALDSSKPNIVEPAKQIRKAISTSITSNPLFKSIETVYSSFYWRTRRNLPYDTPWILFQNSTAQWFLWNQFPHNLPPYRYLDSGQPDDFFCFGLPGNTLPLGNWDPFCFQQVAPSVVRKYRESELKHGRLAMLASVGMVVQELYHPLHEAIGGLAITHIDHLLELTDLKSNVLYRILFEPFLSLLNINVNIEIPLDYIAIILFLMAFEVIALKKNWTRWARDEYYHQFEHNIGVGNLKPTYKNGDYKFDPLQLMPVEPEDQREIQEMELNNGRLAMIAVIGMFAQEYLTGVPVSSTLIDLFSAQNDNISSGSLDLLGFFNSLRENFEGFLSLFQQDTPVTL